MSVLDAAIGQLNANERWLSKHCKGLGRASASALFASVPWIQVDQVRFDQPAKKIISPCPCKAVVYETMCGNSCCGAMFRMVHLTEMILQMHRDLAARWSPESGLLTPSCHSRRTPALPPSSSRRRMESSRRCRRESCRAGKSWCRPRGSSGRYSPRGRASRQKGCC